MKSIAKISFVLSQVAKYAGLIMILVETVQFANQRFKEKFGEPAEPETIKESE